MERKKICFVTRKNILYSLGGVETHTNTIVEEFRERNWEISFVLPKQNINYTQYYNKQDKYYFYKESNINILNIIRCFIKLLKTDSYFFYQKSYSNLLAPVVFYCYIFKKKSIWALANSEESIKKYSRRRINLNFSINTLINIIKYIDNVITDFLVNLSRKKSHYVFVQTEFQKYFLMKNQKINSFLIRNMYNISITDKYKDTLKENNIIWIGLFSKNKRPEIFIKLAEDLKDLEINFIMIGNYRNYKDYVLKCSIPNLKFLGALTNEQTLELLSKSIILVNTSNYEGFPNIFIEAWLLNVFVISYSLDPDNLLLNKKMGKVVNSYNELKSNVKEIILNQKNNNYNLSEINKSAKNYFDVKKNMDVVEKLLIN